MVTVTFPIRDPLNGSDVAVKVFFKSRGKMIIWNIWKVMLASVRFVEAKHRVRLLTTCQSVSVIPWMIWVFTPVKCLGKSVIAASRSKPCPCSSGFFSLAEYQLQNRGVISNYNSFTGFWVFLNLKIRCKQAGKIPNWIVKRTSSELIKTCS